MDNIFETAEEFNLKINPKKSSIMAIKRHKHYENSMDKTKLRGIEI
jgi:hypothetical protein